MISFLIGLAGTLIALVGWFGYHSLVALIIGTVLYLIETIMQLRELNQNAIAFEVIIALIGCLVSSFFHVPFYVGGMVAINLYSAIITLFGIPNFIPSITSLFKYDHKSTSMETVKATYCKYCGGKVDQDTHICTKCGHKFFSIKSIKKPLIIFAFLALVASNIITLYLWKQPELSRQSEDKEEIGNENTNVAVPASKTPSFENTYQDFIVNEETKVFHLPECSNIGTRNVYFKYNDTYNTLIARGFTPCGNCLKNPGLQESSKKEEFDYSSIDLVSVESSVISEVGFDKPRKILLIRFKDSGDLYAYYDVSVTAYSNMIQSESIGTYFNKHIKGQYKYTKLED